MKDYFVNVTKSLDIPEIMIGQIIYVDPIDAILHNFHNHSSIIKIRENVKLSETFNFNKINENQIKKEILELNPRKTSGFDEIPSKIIKNSVTVLTSPLTNLFNTAASGDCSKRAAASDVRRGRGSSTHTAASTRYCLTNPFSHPLEHSLLPRQSILPPTRTLAIASPIHSPTHSNTRYCLTNPFSHPFEHIHASSIFMPSSNHPHRQHHYKTHTRGN